MQADREVAHCVPVYEPARRARWQFNNREEERTESQPLENEETKKSTVPGDAPAPFVPVVNGDEHEEELDRHHSASWDRLVTDVATSRMDENIS